MVLPLMFRRKNPLAVGSKGESQVMLSNKDEWAMDQQNIILKHGRLPFPFSNQQAMLFIKSRLCKIFQLLSVNTNFILGPPPFGSMSEAEGEKENITVIKGAKE